MKLNKKRKGFTLTELAIVIAVIAILVAVLVPTFVSLINKAEESADVQATRNMNTALSTSEATDGNPSNLVEAKKVLSDAGYGDNLIPTTANYTYYWNSEYNIVMLIDTSGSEWQLIYPKTDDANNAYTQYYSSCYNLNVSGTTAELDKILEAVDKGEAISVGGSSGYSIDKIEVLANTYGETFAGATIQLTEDITYSSTDPIKNFQGTFAGGGKTITVTGIVPVYGENGNGYLYSEFFDDGDGVQQYKYSYGLFATVTNGGKVQNVTVNYTNTTAAADPGNEYTYFGGIVGCLDGGTIESCTVTGTITQYNRVGGIAGNVLDGTIKDCTVKANITSKAVETTTYKKGDTAVHNNLKAYSYAGGIVAYVGNKDINSGSLTITGCTVCGTDSNNKLTISADYWGAGGVMAWVSDGVQNISITDTKIEYVDIKVSNADGYIGGICGYVNTSKITSLNATVTYNTVSLYTSTDKDATPISLVAIESNGSSANSTVSFTDSTSS